MRLRLILIRRERWSVVIPGEVIIGALTATLAALGKLLLLLFHH